MEDGFAFVDDGTFRVPDPSGFNPMPLPKPVPLGERRFTRGHVRVDRLERAGIQPEPWLAARSSIADQEWPPGNTDWPDSTSSRQPRPSPSKSCGCGGARGPMNPESTGTRLETSWVEEQDWTWNGRCCCCAEDLYIKLKGKGKSYREGGELVQDARPRRLAPRPGIRLPKAQNKFDVVLSLKYRPGTLPVCDCQMEFWERETLSSRSRRTRGKPVFDWVDKVKSHRKSPTIKPWLEHAERDDIGETCPEDTVLQLPDTPFSDYPRILDAEYRLTSCPTCECEHDQLVIRATQWISDPATGSGDMRFTWEGKGSGWLGSAKGTPGW